MSCTITTIALFFFNDTATTEIYTLSLHDALPISGADPGRTAASRIALHAWRLDFAHPVTGAALSIERSEEHTSELQSQSNLVCRLLLEKKNNCESSPHIGLLAKIRQSRFTYSVSC